VYQANHPLVYILKRKLRSETVRPPSAEHPEDETVPGSPDHQDRGTTFASAPHARERMAALITEEHPKVVILECSAIPDFEYTALCTLIRVEEAMREGGISLWPSALDPWALAVVRRSPWGRPSEMGARSSTFLQR
jgi:sulfate permease, SulP family